MSKHECRLYGTISTRPTTTLGQIKAAFSPFLTAYKLSFEEAMDNGAIEFDGDSLVVRLEYKGAGAEFKDIYLSNTLNKLSPLTEGANWFEVIDYDARSEDDVRVPHFFGSAPERHLAQLKYALLEFAHWAEPIIGRTGVQKVEKVVLEISRN